MVEQPRTVTGRNIVVLAATLLIQVSAAGLSIGVGSVSGNGDACISMPAPRLEPGSVVTLVAVNHQQSAVTAVIEAAAASCARLEDALIPGPFYRLAKFSPAAESGTLWVVFRGKLGSRSPSSGEVTVRLNGANPDAQVRSCTSREGLHLTVWAGQPLKSRRLWHQYYYLGYDVEPSCTDGDVIRD